MLTWTVSPLYQPGTSLGLCVRIFRRKRELGKPGGPSPIRPGGPVPEWYFPELLNVVAEGPKDDGLSTSSG